MGRRLEIPPSIADTIEYQNALLAVEEAAIKCEATAHKEESKKHQVARITQKAALRSLAAAIDCFCAKQIQEAIR